MLNKLDPYYNFYSVASNSYATKLFATIAAKSISNEHDIIWHLPNFEKEIDKIDITVEPCESLGCLYKCRAQQLRHDYDYLILHYSGGHDSHNILETFMFNNIFIDEILILDQFDPTFRKTLEDKNFEFLHQNAYEAEYSAIPLAKHFINTFSPKTKLTIVPNSFAIHAKYWLSLSQKQMMENLKGSGTFGVIGKPPIRYKDLNQYNNTWRQLKERKKVAHIWGRDKVSLRYDNVGYFFNFVDGALVDYIDSTTNLTGNDLPQNVEFFYTHPNMVKTIVKQAHILMKNLPFYKVNVPLITRAYEDMLAKIIYNRQIQSAYQGFKAGDFRDWTKYLDKKRDSSRDLSLFNMTELVLCKTLDIAVAEKLNLQIQILSDLLKESPTNVEGIMGANYSTKKFYISKFQ